MGLPEYRAHLEKDPSYPSGHTAVGWGFALILSEWRRIAPTNSSPEAAPLATAAWSSTIIGTATWYGAASWARPRWRDCTAIQPSARTWTQRGTKSPPFAPKTSRRRAIARRRPRPWPWLPGERRDRHRRPPGAGRDDAPTLGGQQRPPAEALPQGLRPRRTHNPHITLIQRFVRTDDLDKVYAALDQVLARADVTAMKLEAFKYYYIPMKDVGVAGIVAKPTPELIKLQADIVAAVTPFTVATGRRRS